MGTTASSEGGYCDIRQLRGNFLIPKVTIIVVIVSIIILSQCGGCATTNDNDSEIPWNAPQPWEGNLLHGIMREQ